MGITGLLGMLKSVTYNAHLEQFAGMRAAVDTYCWLHRGTYSCSTELIMDGDSDKYVNFCLSRVDMLLRYNIEPIMIFDGGPLPMKAGKEDEREEKRRVNMERGREFLASGENGKAAQVFSKAVDVSTNMAAKLISALRSRGVKFIVAPYEADAQLAYMSRNNLCDLVISEDSDCLPYGCKTVLFKLDKSGNGEVIEARKLVANQDLSLTHFSQDMFLDMCILSGCDYLPSIKGIGLKRAHQLVQQYKKTDRILRGIRFSNSFDVPRDYEKRFHQARLTFRHQRVYCPKREEVVPLTPLVLGNIPKPLLAKSAGSSQSQHDFAFLGCEVERELAQGVANGHLDPVTKEPYPEWTTRKAGTLPKASDAADDADEGSEVNESSTTGSNAYEQAEALLRGTVSGGGTNQHRQGGMNSANVGFSARKAAPPSYPKQKQTMRAFLCKPGSSGGRESTAIPSHPAPPVRARSRVGGLYRHFGTPSKPAERRSSTLNQPAHVKALNRPFVSPIVAQQQQQSRRSNSSSGDDEQQLESGQVNTTEAISEANSESERLSELRSEANPSTSSLRIRHVSFAEASLGMDGLDGRGGEQGNSGGVVRRSVDLLSTSCETLLEPENSDPNPWKKLRTANQRHSPVTRSPVRCLGSGSSRFFPAATTTTTTATAAPSSTRHSCRDGARNMAGRNVSMVPFEARGCSSRPTDNINVGGAQGWEPAAVAIERESNSASCTSAAGEDYDTGGGGVERIDQENESNICNSPARNTQTFECAAQAHETRRSTTRMSSRDDDNGSFSGAGVGVVLPRRGAGGGLARVRNRVAAGSETAAVGAKSFARFAFSPAAAAVESESGTAAGSGAGAVIRSPGQHGGPLGVLRYSEARALRTSATIAFYSS